MSVVSSNEEINTNINDINNIDREMNNSFDELIKIVTCPITLDILVDPWSITLCNHTFEKRALVELYLKGANQCPLCRINFNLTQIKQNNILKSMLVTTLNILKNVTNIKENKLIDIPDTIKSLNEIKNEANIKYDKDGNIYEGEIKNNKMNGFGIMTYKTSYNLVKYEGDWKDDKKSGKGTLIFKSGSIYEGDWTNNKREGHGVMNYFKQNKYITYVGDWKGDKKNGQGTMIYSNGDVYEGNWDNNKMCGQGIMTYYGGDKYEGNWKDDKMNGEGIMNYGNGTKYEGKWKNGIIYKEKEVIKLFNNLIK